MSLEPAPKDLSRCCTKCTRKPYLDGCRQGYGCPCHGGYTPAKPVQVIRDIHACLQENCDEGKTANPFDDPFRY